MKVVYKRHGGFAPITVASAFDTETCNPDDAKKLRQLVDDSRILQSESKSVRGARDVRYHSITVQDNGKEVDVTFDDLSISAEMRPLIDFLQSHAKNIFDDDE